MSRRPSHRLTDGIGDGAGRLERKRVPALGAHADRATDVGCHAVSDACIALVAGTGDDRDGDVELRQPRPKRFLSSLAERPQLVLESGDRRGLSPSGSLLCSLPQRGEQRLGQPLSEEGLDTGPGHVTGQLVVGPGPAARSPSSSMPGEALTTTRPRTRCGASRAARRHNRPPME